MPLRAGEVERTPGLAGRSGRVSASPERPGQREPRLGVALGEVHTSASARFALPPVSYPPR